jgi:hypothetical protein
MYGAGRDRIYHSKAIEVTDRFRVNSKFISSLSNQVTPTGYSERKRQLFEIPGASTTRRRLNTLTYAGRTMTNFMNTISGFRSSTKRRICLGWKERIEVEKDMDDSKRYHGNQGVEPSDADKQ